MKSLFEDQTKQWRDRCKEWELAIVFWAWDNGVGTFPPEARTRKDLGDHEVEHEGTQDEGTPAEKPDSVPITLARLVYRHWWRRM